MWCQSHKHLYSTHLKNKKSSVIAYQHIEWCMDNVLVERRLKNYMNDFQEKPMKNSKHIHNTRHTYTQTLNYSCCFYFWIPLLLSKYQQKINTKLWCSSVITCDKNHYIFYVTFKECYFMYVVNVIACECYSK